jgi:acetyltransferase-like isoleucine patch superfamily enzyme
MKRVINLPYYSEDEIASLGLRYFGKDVKISTRAVIQNPETTSIGDHSRIDDFCVLSGIVNIGRYVHLAVFNNLAGGKFGITFEDASAMAYGCHVFTQTDDYSGNFLVSPLFDSSLTNVSGGPITIGTLSTIGTGAIIFPNVTLGEGSAIGALSIVNKSTLEWSISVGQPARHLKARSKKSLDIWLRFNEKNF